MGLRGIAMPARVRLTVWKLLAKYHGLHKRSHDAAEKFYIKLQAHLLTEDKRERQALRVELIDLAMDNAEHRDEALKIWHELLGHHEVAKSYNAQLLRHWRSRSTLL